MEVFSAAAGASASAAGAAAAHTVEVWARRPRALPQPGGSGGGGGASGGAAAVSGTWGQALHLASLLDGALQAPPVVPPWQQVDPRRQQLLLKRAAPGAEVTPHFKAPTLMGAEPKSSGSGQLPGLLPPLSPLGLPLLGLPPLGAVGAAGSTAPQLWAAAPSFAPPFAPSAPWLSPPAAAAPVRDEDDDKDDKVLSELALQAMMVGDMSRYTALNSKLERRQRQAKSSSGPGRGGAASPVAAAAVAPTAAAPQSAPWAPLQAPRRAWPSATPAPAPAWAPTSGRGGGWDSSGGGGGGLGTDDTAAEALLEEAPEQYAEMLAGLFDGV